MKKVIIITSVICAVLFGGGGFLLGNYAMFEQFSKMENAVQTGYNLQTEDLVNIHALSGADADKVAWARWAFKQNMFTQEHLKRQAFKDLFFATFSMDKQKELSTTAQKIGNLQGLNFANMVHEQKISRLEKQNLQFEKQKIALMWENRCLEENDRFQQQISDIQDDYIAALRKSLSCALERNSLVEQSLQSAQKQQAVTERLGEVLAVIGQGGSQIDLEIKCLALADEIIK